MYSNTQFKIMKLEGEKQQKSIESIAVFVFSLFTAIFLPQLLFTYLYADQQLLEEPLLLKYIPVVTFVLGVGYFLYSILVNMLKSREIKQLSMEMGDDLEDFLGDSDLEEVQSIVDEILAETETNSKKKAPAKKAKAATKKAPAKKTAAKKKTTKKSTKK